MAVHPEQRSRDFDPTDFGRTLFVDATIGASGKSGYSAQQPKATIQQAVNIAEPGDVIVVAPGEYDEAVTIPWAEDSPLTIKGAGPRGSVFIVPSDADATALTNHRRDVTLVNIGLEGNGNGGGLVNTGRRFRAYACKIEKGANAAILTLGTVAQIAAETHDKGDDALLEDCEIAYASAAGLKLVGTDYGAVTQVRIRGCYFHGNPAASIEEAGTTASLQYRDLDVDSCVFGQEDLADDGTYALPTAWIKLNDNNANSGIVHDCVFPDVLAGGRNLVSTSLIWVANRHTAGLSTGQPS